MSHTSFCMGRQYRPPPKKKVEGPHFFFTSGTQMALEGLTYMDPLNTQQK